MVKSLKIKENDFVPVDYKTLLALNHLGVANGKEIILFCKIMHLSHNDDRACTAGNEYLATFLCTSERNVRKYLEDLKDKRLIKSYEKKEGMRTTVRYLYPQYTTFDEAFYAAVDSEGAEQKGQSSGTNGSEERNKKVKPEEQSFHHIKEYNRTYNNIFSDKPEIDLQSCNTEEKLTTDIIYKIYDFYKNGIDYDEISLKTGLDAQTVYNVIEDGKAYRFAALEDRPFS